MSRAWSQALGPWSLATATLLVLLALPSWWQPLIDPDLWWLLWAGETALESGAFPTRNVLSYTAPDHPWITHEWGVALLYGGIGVDRVPWARIVCHGATLAGLAALVHRCRSGWAAVVAVLWLSPMLAHAFTERALAWGNLCLVGFMLVLPQEGRRSMVLRWSLLALWANLHGSFVLGLGLLALHRPREILPGALVTLLNPHGIGLWQLVLGYGTGQGAQGLVHAYVEEWQPMWPDSLLQVVRLGCLGFAGWASLRFGGHRDRLLWLAVTVLAVRHWRYCAPAALLLLPLVCTALSQRLPPRPPGQPLWVLLPVLCVAALFSPRQGPDPDRYPSALLEELPAGARVWSDFTLGAWLSRGGHPAFWDSRNDCYPPAILEDGMRVAWQLQGWKGVLQAWEIDVVVTAQEALQASLLGAGWELRWQEGGVSALVPPGDSG